MSVLFRLHQDQSHGTARSGKWYARAVPIGVINTRGLAEIIQRNCTVKRSDVMAVIEELVEVMHEGPDAGLQACEARRLRLVQNRPELQGCPLCQGLHHHRQHRGHARGIHPRAQPRPGWQPREAVPARRKGGRAA